MRKSDSLVEKVLLLKIAKDDKDAFSAIFTAYYNDLVVFARTCIHENETAEEIVQEIFLKLWEARHESYNIGSLKSFLLKSVQNKCIDYLRHKKIRQQHQNEVMNSNVLFEFNTDNYLLRSELEEQLKKAMLILPEDCAEAFRMNREEGFKYQEIAEKLNVSVRTVEVRIGKALYLLRKSLSEYL